MSGDAQTRAAGQTAMDQTRDTFCTEIEHRIGRIACDAILDPSPDAVAAQVEAVAADLDAAGLADAAARIRALAHEPVDRIGDRLNAEWSDWRAVDELRGDVEALGGDAELSSMFVAEALDHLGTIEATLLKLEESPDDKTLLNDVFRPFHTVKGNAGALGLVTVQQFAHTVESLLDRCRSGKHQVGSVEVDIVLKSVDLLTALITDIAAQSAGAPGRNLRTERLQLLDALEQLMAAGSSRQEPALNPPGEFRLDDPRAATTPLASATTPAPAPAAAVSAVAAPAVQTTGRADTAIDATVKVDTRKLDGLVDMVGELVILQSLIHENPSLARINDERLTRNLAQLRRITTDLQRGAMSMRMVPIRQTFQKMSRLVRDLCRKSGKQVELTLVGEETELDRKVVEDINDPLMHMIRNSVDHGIESVETRRTAGKRDVGHMWLRAFHQGGNIVIEVADDGGGLNKQRILDKAIAQGLVAADQKLSDDEIHQLIFKPGFSTAEQVTEILRARCRHGRRPSEHRRVARPHRHREHAGRRHDVLDQAAAHAGDPRRAARRVGRRAVRRSDVRHSRIAPAAAGARAHHSTGAAPRAGARSARAARLAERPVRERGSADRPVGRDRRGPRRRCAPRRARRRSAGGEAGGRGEVARRGVRECARRGRRRHSRRRTYRSDSGCARHRDPDRRQRGCCASGVAGDVP
ncbi:MAG: Hpt domain-containing protein [Vicinamibacterales bacterium]